MRGLTSIAVVAAVALWLVAGSVAPAAVVYEGFNYTDYSNGGLNGQNGGIGFDTPWAVVSNNTTANRLFSVQDPATDVGLAFGPLETTGSYIYRPNSSDRTHARRTLDTGNALVSGLLDDGATMWFSLVLNRGANTGDRAGFALTSGPLNIGDNPTGRAPNLQTAGDGFGVYFDSDTLLKGFAWDNQTTGTESSTGLDISGGVTDNYLIVGEIQWNAVGTPDVMYLYSSDEMGYLSEFATISADLDQASTINMTTFWSKQLAEFDELRIGRSDKGVLPGIYAPITWTGAGGDGLWSTTANWDSTLFPISGDRAVLGNGETIYVDDDTVVPGEGQTIDELSVTEGTIEINTGMTLTVETTLNMPAWETSDLPPVTITPRLIMDSGSKLSVGNGAVASLDTDGDAEIHVVGAMTVDTLTGPYDPSTLSKTGPGTLTAENTLYMELAALSLQGGTLQLKGADPLGASSTRPVDLAGGSLTIDATAAVNATGRDVSLSAPAATLRAGGADVSFGALTIADGATLSTSGAGQLSFTSTELLGGSATIDAAGRIVLGTFDDLGAAKTLVVRGGGQGAVVLDNQFGGDINVQNTELRVESGTLEGMGARPFGSGDAHVTLAGGRLKVSLGGGTFQSAPAGAAAYWALDEAPGATTTVDSSGNGHDGTIQGGVTTGLTGVLGSSYQFNGTDGYVNIDGWKGITGDAPRTVSAWVKTDPSALNAAVLSWGLNNATEKWVFRLQDSNGLPGTIRVEVNGGYIVGSTDIRDNQWHQVAAVLPEGGTDVTDVLLYVDGTLESISASGASAINTAVGNDVWIGTDPNNKWWQGGMDELYVYPYALDGSDVSLLYDLGALGPGLSGDVDASGTAITVEADATINAVSDGDVSFGALDFAGDHVLTTTGALGTISFAGTTLSGVAGGDLALVTTSDTRPGPIDFNNRGGTIVKRGAGSLILDADPLGMTEPVTYEVRNGQIVAKGPAPLGSADLVMAGGGLTLASADGSDETYDNAITVTADATITAGSAGVGTPGGTIILPNLDLGSSLVTLAVTDADGIRLPGPVTAAAAGLQITGPVTVEGAIDLGTLRIAGGALARTGDGGPDGNVTVHSELTLTDAELVMGSGAGTKSLLDATGAAVTVNAGGLLSVNDALSAASLELNPGGQFAGDGPLDLGALRINDATLARTGDGTPDGNVTVHSELTLTDAELVMGTGAGTKSLLDATGAAVTVGAGGLLSVNDALSAASLVVSPGGQFVRTGDPAAGQQDLTVTAGLALSVPLDMTGARQLDAATAAVDLNPGGSLTTDKKLVVGALNLNGGQLNRTGNLGADPASRDIQVTTGLRLTDNETLDMVATGGAVITNANQTAIDLAPGSTLRADQDFQVYQLIMDSSTLDAPGHTVTGSLGPGGDVFGIKLNNVTLEVNLAGLQGVAVDNATENQVVVLNGTNSYLGQTRIDQGALLVQPDPASPDPNNIGQGALLLDANAGGQATVLMTSGSFTRSLGTGFSQVSWSSNGGGFAAKGGDLTVNISAGATISYGTGGLAGGTLHFGHSTADGKVTFQNGLDLAGANNRRVQVWDNPNTDADFAEISGKITGGDAANEFRLNEYGNGRAVGLLYLSNHNNDYTSDTVLMDGILRVDGDGEGLPTQSTLRFRANEDNGNTTARPVVLETKGLFERNIGTGAGEVHWDNANNAGGGGFAAVGGPLTVTLEGGAQLLWGNTDQGFQSRRLMLGSPNADNVVTLTNDIHLGDSRDLFVFDNPDSDADYAVLSGVVNDNNNDNTHNFNKRGDGLLEMTAVNTYPGRTFVREGTLKITGALSGTLRVNVQDTATLTGGGSITTTNVNGIQIETGGTLAPGDGVGAITLATENLDMAGGSIYAWQVGDLTNVLGDLSLGAGWKVNVMAGGSGFFSAEDPHVLFVSTGIVNLAQPEVALDPGAPPEYSLFGPQVGLNAATGEVYLTGLDAIEKYNWDGSQAPDESWDTAANWDSDLVPTDEKMAVLANGDTIEVGGPAMAYVLQLENGTVHVAAGTGDLTIVRGLRLRGGTMAVEGTLTADFTNTAGLAVAPGGTVNVGSSLTVDSALDMGTGTWNYSTADLTVSPAGSLTAVALTPANLDVQGMANVASVDVGGGQVTISDGGQLAAAGAIGAGGLDVQGTASADSVDVGSGPMTVGGRLTTAGAVTAGDVDVASTGQMTAGALLTAGNVSIDAGGSLSAGGVTASQDMTVSGDLTTTGDLTATGAFRMRGGTLHSSGNVTVSAGEVSIAGKPNLDVAAGSLTVPVAVSAIPASGAGEGVYHFEGDLYDSSGNFLDGTWANTSTTPTFETGKIGQAVRLAGYDDVTMTGDGVDLDGWYTAAFDQRTIAMWVHQDDATGDQVLVDEGGQTNGIGLTVRDGVLEAGVITGSVGFTVTDPQATDLTDGFHHVAVTYGDGDSVLRLFVDGKQVAFLDTGLGTIIDQGNESGVGYTAQGQSYYGGPLTPDYFSGLADELYFYNSASFELVSALYAAGTGVTAFGDLTMAAGTELTLTDTGTAGFDLIAAGDGATIHGTAVTVLGEVAPAGDGLGAFTVDASFTMAGNSAYVWGSDGTTSDLVHVTGDLDASADWQLVVSPQGVVAGGPYTLMQTTAGTLSGPGTVAVLADAANPYAELVDTAGSSVAAGAANDVVLNLAMVETEQWKGTGTSWTDAGNWLDGVPTSASGAVIANAATVATVSSAGQAARTLIIDGGSVEVQPAGVLDVAQNAHVLSTPGSQLVVGGQMSAAALNSAATTTVQGGGSLSVGAANITQGATTVTGAGSSLAVSGAVELASGASLGVADGASLTAATVNSSGTLGVTGGATALIDQLNFGAAGAEVSIAGSTATVGEVNVTQGLLSVGAGSSASVGRLFVSATGQVSAVAPVTVSEVMNFGKGDYKATTGTFQVTGNVETGSAETVILGGEGSVLTVPASFLQAKIGDGLEGSASESAGTWTITGSGSDIWGAADGCYFVYREFDVGAAVDISARVGVDGFVGGTNGWRKAGVMIRDSLAPESRNAFSLIAEADGNGINAQIRPSDGATSLGATGTGPRITHDTPAWLRLTYAGDGRTFTMYWSDDPDTLGWNVLGTNIMDDPMTGTFLAGMAVTAHDATQQTTVEFDSLGGALAPPGFHNLTGAGTIAGSILVDGTLAPGGSIGTIAVQGDVTLLGSSLYAVELTGNATDGTYDKVDATGGLMIEPGARLGLTWLAGAAGASKFGGTYTVAGAGSVAGEVTLDAAAGNIGAAYVQGIAAGTTGLEVSLYDLVDGDANVDAVVDVLDYVVVSNNFGVGDNWRRGDVNMDGVVDVLDYVVISNNFGSTPSAGAALGLSAGSLDAAAVPEPGTLLLLMCGALGLLVLFRRRGR